MCVVQFLEERQCGIVEEILGQESKALASHPGFATYTLCDLDQVSSPLWTSVFAKVDKNDSTWPMHLRK